jgi:hypothetical protein
MRETINLFDAESAGGRIDLAALAGSSDTAIYLYDIAPGASSSPYHYEYVEEWLLVVAGEGRGADPGRPARTLLMSAVSAPAVSVYPDSGKVGVWPDERDEWFFRTATAVDWADGEDGWERAQ